jgi:hypothetical protein
LERFCRVSLENLHISRVKMKRYSSLDNYACRR